MHKIVFACELVKNIVVLAAFSVAFSNSRNFYKYFENLGRKIYLIIFTYIWFVLIVFMRFNFYDRPAKDFLELILAILIKALLLFFVVNFVIKNVKKASATLILWAMFIAYLTTNYFRINTGWNDILTAHIAYMSVICSIPFLLVVKFGIFYEHRLYVVHKLNELIQLKTIQLILVIFTSFYMSYFYFQPYNANEMIKRFWLLAIGSYFLFSISVDLLIRKVIKSKLSLENWAQKHDLVIPTEELPTIQLDWGMPNSILKIISLLSCQLIIYYFLLINGTWDYFFCILNMTMLVSTIYILNRNKWLKFTRKYNYIQNEITLDYIKTIHCSFFCSAYTSCSKKEVCGICLEDNATMYYCELHFFHHDCIACYLYDTTKDILKGMKYKSTLHQISEDHIRVYHRDYFSYEFTINRNNLPKCPLCIRHKETNSLEIEVESYLYGKLLPLECADVNYI